jgi:peptide/nickel transport system ATP-binding protein
MSALRENVAPAEPVVRVTDLAVELRRDDRTTYAVDGVSLIIAPGEAVGLVGESGSGKTTLGLALLGLLPAGGRITNGVVEVAGVDVTAATPEQLRGLRGNRAAIVFQDPMTSLNPTATIGWQVAEPLRLHGGLDARAAAAGALDALELVQLPEPRRQLGRYPHELSGGMRQRACIAMALVCRPALLIADEPTTALDVTIQDQILALFDELRSELAMSLLLITHDIGVVADRCDRTVVMYGARAVESAPTRALLAGPRHRYTQALLTVAPSITTPTGERLATIPGSAPDLTQHVEGCPFTPRCNYASAACSAARPPEVRAGKHWIHACVHPAEPQPRRELTAVDGRDAATGAAASSPLLSIEDLVRHYPLDGRWLGRSDRVVHAPDGVSFHVGRGETLAVVGESGCGKSTLGRLVVALDRPTRGIVRFDAEDLYALPRGDLRKRRRDLQLVFQDPNASLDPRMKVGAIVREPLAIQHSGTASQQRARVVELLTDVGLDASTVGRYPHELSGGMRQRVGIARALALHPKLIVADEPVSGLDVSVRAQVLNLLRDLQRRHELTYVVISHDLTTVRNVADRVAVMYLGRIVELGHTSTVYDDPAHPYTAALLAAVPDPVRRRDEGPSVGGEVPSATDPPSGCRFRTRCPRATEVCLAVDPPLVQVQFGRSVACHHPVHRGHVPADRPQGATS